MERLSGPDPLAATGHPSGGAAGVSAHSRDFAARRADDGAPGLSEAQLTELATNIAEDKRRAGPAAPRAAATATAAANVSSLAEALGTDADTLLRKLQSGGDLATLLRGASGYGSPATVTGGLTVDRYA